MKHVALFQDTVVACWPLAAAEEYKKKFGPDAFRKENYGREAVFLGEWLYSHMNEFEIVKSVVGIEGDNKIYAIREFGLFVWSAEYDICKVKVADVLDDEHWLIEYEDHGCQEKLVVITEPDEYGFVQTARVSM